MFSSSICQFPHRTVPTEPSLFSFLCFLPFPGLPSLLSPLLLLTSLYTSPLGLDKVDLNCAVEF